MEGPYTYRILRYVHDIGTAEFINVGVVVALCDAPCVKARFTTECGRVKRTFPSLDAEVFLARMKRLQASFDAIDAATSSHSMWMPESSRSTPLTAEAELDLPLHCPGLIQLHADCSYKLSIQGSIVGQ